MKDMPPFAYTTIGLCSMAMSTEVQAQVSKKDTIVLGGNMALRRGLGGGSVTLVLRRQLSPISSVEVLATVGFRSILSFQTSRCVCWSFCNKFQYLSSVIDLDGMDRQTNR
jgi:hypothetical protein